MKTVLRVDPTGYYYLYTLRERFVEETLIHNRVGIGNTGLGVYRFGRILDGLPESLLSPLPCFTLILRPGPDIITNFNVLTKFFREFNRPGTKSKGLIFTSLF